MATIAVTGGTGTLGRPTVAALREAGHDVRVVSRRSGPDLVSADLLTRRGLTRALDGVDVVVHLATGRHDDEAARVLAAEVVAVGVGHLIDISIVGVDRIPLPYYQRKLAAERAVAASGAPFTVLRATQFHDLVAALFSSQRRLPVLAAPAFPFQPIDVGDVADRLTELAGGPPAGRVADIGGPEVAEAAALASLWAQAAGLRRSVWPVRLPGRTFAGYRAGHHLVPGPGYGTRTFRQYVTDGPSGLAPAR